MKEGQKLWTREESILAINLYCKTQFGKMHRTNPAVKDLAVLINRSVGAVVRKLGNFASFDPTLQARGIKGLRNTSKLDEEIWDEFYRNWDSKLIESETLLAKVKKTTIEKLNNIDLSDLPTEGIERKRLVKTRVNQCLFRTIILATYDYKCCITGISNPELLIASHILPWSKDEKNRMNPMNGLVLNALHDKAFEVGLITIDADTYKIRVSPSLIKKNAPPTIRQNFIDYNGKGIELPHRFLPDRQFLKEHNDTRFRS